MAGEAQVFRPVRHHQDNRPVARRELLANTSLGNYTDDDIDGVL